MKKRIFIGLLLSLFLISNAFCAEKLVLWDTTLNKYKTATGEQGDIFYYNGTDWIVLHHGINGQFLKTQGDGANPVWASVPLHFRFTIIDPSGSYSLSSNVCMVSAIDADITIDSITVTTSSASYEVAGDLMYADTFIGLANAAVINDFDTTSGVRADNSITNASVPSGKCIYISFDSQPNSSMKQVNFDIAYHY